MKMLYSGDILTQSGGFHCISTVAYKLHCLVVNRDIDRILALWFGGRCKQIIVILVGMC